MRFLVIPTNRPSRYTQPGTGFVDVVELDPVDEVSGPIPVVEAADLASLLVDQHITDLTAKPVPVERVKPPPPVPRLVKHWRIKAALKLAGVLGQVEQLLPKLPEPQRTIALTAWESGADFERGSATVIAISSQLKLTEKQVDELFIQAAGFSI